jgi:collagenase-like PrtC family protease
VSPGKPVPAGEASRQTSFSVAANYDADLIPALSRYPVDEVYGKFPGDGVSGGRPTYMASALSGRGLRDYLETLQRHGIAFNYLLNGACFGNREWTRSWQKNLSRLLARLQGMGVQRLTVSSPFLLELVKKRFPEFRIKVGIYAQVDTPRRARYWEDLGADGITLESFSINRDLRRLTAIRAAVSCDLQLIANHLCLPNCPMQVSHQNGFAHASDGSGVLFIDHCALRCSRLRLEDPSLFIKAGWIRPEDVGVYEALGFSTFKLLERDIPSAALLRRVEAYSQRRFEGNLAELFLSYGFKEPPHREPFWALRNFFKPWQANPLKLRVLLDLARQQGMLFAQPETPIQIDSRQIPADFLDGFRDRDCASLACKDCGYCERIAARAVTVSAAFRSESRRRYAELEEALAKGRLWGV